MNPALQRNAGFIGGAPPVSPPADVRERQGGDAEVARGSAEIPIFRSMGIDTADLVHLAVLEREGIGPRRLIHAAEVDSDEAVPCIAKIRERFGVRATVVDSKPLRVEARAIAAQAPASTWLLDFAGNEEPKEKEGVHEGKRFLRVLLDREEMIDDVVDALTTDPPGLVLPRPTAATEGIVRLVRAHLRNLKREAVKSSTGRKAHRYRKDVPNHLAFAIGMALLAERISGGAAGFASVVADSPPGSKYRRLDIQGVDRRRIDGRRRPGRLVGLIWER